jgi:signal transduction histidine kinase
MRERVEALGGRLHAGPAASGWSVSAHVPLGATAPVAGEAFAL